MRSKSRRGRTYAGAAVAAVGLHLGLALLIGASLSRTRLKLVEPADAAVMFASLTPASELTSSTAPPPADALSSALSDMTPAAAAAPPKKPSGRGDDLLAQMDAAPPTPAKAAPPAAKMMAGNPSKGVAKLDDAPNPWAQASAAIVDRSRTHELWRAAQRCWHGSSGAMSPSSIRVVLDRAGEVTAMSWIGGGVGDPGARAQAEAVAAAIDACGPYRTVVATAGAYLVTGPST